MRKQFGPQPYLYPQPVLIIASYDEAGNADAMNAAWGSIADYETIAMYLSPNHKTIKNICSSKAFTVSMATRKQLAACDYVGLVSGNDTLDKMDKSGFHTIRSEMVHAPLIQELPMALECEFQSYDDTSHLLLGRIVNVSADESILDEAGKIDPFKLDPISYDAIHHTYLTIGEIAGHAFKEGNQLK